MSTSQPDAKTRRAMACTRALVDPTPIRIQPFRGWQMFDLQEFWRFRELLLFLSWRDIRVRYRQTLIGAAWAIVQPLCMVAVLSLFLGKVARVTSTETPYYLFAFCGLLPWLFFSSAVNNAANSVLNSEKLVTKVYFPRILIPFASIGSCLLDLFIAGGLLIVMVILAGPQAWTMQWLAAPFMLLAIALMAIGVGCGLASLNVAYRDFKFVLPLVMQLWLFATPSIYLDIRGEEFGDRLGRQSSLAGFAMQCNPLNQPIAIFRDCMLGSPIPWEGFWWSMATGLVLFTVGVVMFRWSEHRFADII